MRLPFAAVALLIGCAPSEGPPISATAAPIVNGTIDVGDPPVVALMFMGQPFCTGTLISPRVVLTAAHCVDESLTGGIQIEQLDVFFGTETTGGGTTIHVVGGTIHPAWDIETVTNDLALLEIAIAAPVSPATPNETPFDDGVIGRPIRIVGFGVTSATSTMAGTKRQATSLITGYDATEFTYGGTPGQTCFGDSGGPAFMTIGDGGEVLVGVTSTGDENCMVWGLDMRVDAYYSSFIEPFVTAVEGDCGPNGMCVEGCTPADPDCDDNPCASNDVCMPGCMPRDSDCFCESDSVCDLGCSPKDPDCVGEVPIGEICADNYDCQSGYCGAAADDPTFRYCSRVCATNNDCPTGIGGAPMHCEDTEVELLRVCSYDIPSPGTTGASCQVGTDCRSGRCVPHEDGSICTELCVAEGGADCPLGYSCGETLVGDETVHVCLPAGPGPSFCAVAPGAPRALGLLALAAMSALVVIWRRKRR